MYVCMCVHVFVCMYGTNVCKNIAIISFSSSLQNENGMCVYIGLCACMCVCVCVANGCTYMFFSLGSEGVKDFNANVADPACFK